MILLSKLIDWDFDIPSLLVVSTANFPEIKVP